MIRITTRMPHPPADHLIAAAAAGLLDIAPASVRKLAEAGLITQEPEGYPRTEIEALAALPLIEAHHGEIAVLRTTGCGSPNATTPGVHIEMDEPSLDQACLGMWRGDTERILAAHLFVVTVATIPLAVYRLTGILHTEGTGHAQRHRLGGTLLARRGHHSTSSHDTALQADADLIMTGRVITTSGGPIAYLGEPHPTSAAR